VYVISLKGRVCKREEYVRGEENEKSEFLKILIGGVGSLPWRSGRVQ